MTVLRAPSRDPRSPRKVGHNVKRLPAILFLVGACSFGSTSPDERKLAELRYNQRVWNDARVRDYDFYFQMSCFCPAEWVRTRQVSVRGGVVTAVADSATGGPIPFLTNERQPTIDSLFVQAEQAIRTEDAKAEVRFARPLGYPEYVSLVRERVADGDWTVEVRGLIRR